MSTMVSSDFRRQSEPTPLYGECKHFQEIPSEYSKWKVCRETDGIKSKVSSCILFL